MIAVFEGNYATQDKDKILPFSKTIPETYFFLESQYPDSIAYPPY